MLKQIITNELAHEREILQKLKSSKSKLTNLVLNMSSEGKFYYYVPGNKHRKYIRRSNRKLLRQITGSRFLKEKINILESNIAAIEKILDKLNDYSDDAIISSLPVTYSRAINYLRETDPAKGVIQSENPKNRDELNVICSNCLRVRTKGELIIAEVLIELGVDFRYEKALELVEKIPQPDGSFRYNTITVYPDFTIFFPDGSVLYWEHAGLYDKESYRKKQHKKFDNYYDNGIYPPKNLIITMDSQDKPIDNIAIRNIVEAMILPRY